MIPATDSITITTLRAKGMESIVEWFKQHIQSFYSLGWSYLRSKQQMEELFYRSIRKVHQELPHFKNDISFETWVLSIFITICRELSKDNSFQVLEENERRQDLYKALDHLKEDEREALVLTYINGLSHEETAHFLQISVEKMKELLFSGMQALRKELGYGATFNGCKEYQKDYIDYFERNLEHSRKLEIEIHVYQCQDCQNDLGTFQDVILNLSEASKKLLVPSELIDNINARLTKEKMQRHQKFEKRKRIGSILAGIFALLIGTGYFTGTFTRLYYSWTEENLELRYYYQEDLAERLNLEAESNGIKIKIKSAVADEFQTVIYYEIEDTNEEHQYMMNYEDGVVVENEYEIMRTDSYPRFYPPDLDSSLNNEKKNVYYGKMSLLPINIDAEKIMLRITRVQKLIRDENSPLGYVMDYDRNNYVMGEWDFEIPVTQKPTAEYVLDNEIDIDGVPVRFDKLIMSPTTTILQYSVNFEPSGTKQISVVNIDDLEVNNKKVKADMYGSFYMETQQDVNWTSYQMNFDPILEEDPKEVGIRLQSAFLLVNDKKMIELDATLPYPQSFEYAGSTLTIEKLEVGETTKMVISDPKLKDRAYDTLHYNILGDENQTIIYIDMSSEGVIVDRNGKVYELDENFVSYEQIDGPRYLHTVEQMTFQTDNPNEKAIPKWLEIYGYATTVYLDEVVKVNLKE